MELRNHNSRRRFRSSALFATYISVVSRGSAVGGCKENGLCLALSTTSTLQLLTGWSHNASRSRFSREKITSSVTSRRYRYSGAESWTCTQFWCRDRHAECNEHRPTSRCGGTSEGGQVSTPMEGGVEGTQQGEWTDTSTAAAAATTATGTDIMRSRGINGVGLRNEIGHDSYRTWKSTPSSDEHEKGKHARREGKDEISPTHEVEEDLRVPRHVAFVMDGNGRWATNRKMPRKAGHAEGARRAGEAVEACRELGVEFVTLYAFSTENWNRPALEVSFIMKLMENTLREQRDGLRRNGIRLTVIGELHRLPPRLRSLLRDIQRETNDYDATKAGGAAKNVGSSGKRSPRPTAGLSAIGTSPAISRSSGKMTVVAGAPRLNGDDNSCGCGDGSGVGAVHRNERGTTGERPRMTLCLAISYGGRAEVVRAARELAEEAAAGALHPGDINEESLGRRLSTARLGIPDPDLVVRTSGESRLSNLLLWQAAYSELYVVSKTWPEFRRPDLVEAFRDFGTRKRRFGKTSDQEAGAP